MLLLLTSSRLSREETLVKTPLHGTHFGSSTHATYWKVISILKLKSESHKISRMDMIMINTYISAFLYISTLMKICCPQDQWWSKLRIWSWFRRRFRIQQSESIVIVRWIRFLKQGKRIWQSFHSLAIYNLQSTILAIHTKSSVILTKTYLAIYCKIVSNFGVILWYVLAIHSLHLEAIYTTKPSNLSPMPTLKKILQFL